MRGSLASVLLPSYDANAKTLFARITAVPSPSRKRLISNLTKALGDAGIWAKLDLLYVFAAADAQSALLNWKASTNTASNGSGAPAFIADRGYTFDGSANYLTTSFNPSTAGGQFTQNDFSMFMWAFDQSAISRAGNSQARLSLTTSPSFSTRANDITTTSNTPGASGRLFGIYRVGATGYTQTVNGVDLASPVVVSIGLTNANLTIGAQADAAAFGAGGIRAFGAGGSLTAGQFAALYAALNAYFSGVGAV